MTTERTTHRIDETGDIFCADGYDWIEASEKMGWHTISAWGKDGWNAGGWPLVTFSMRRNEDGTLRANVQVEGDITEVTGDRDDVMAWLDQAIAFHWLVGQSDGPVQCYVDADGNPTEHQSWSTRINLVQRRLHEHLVKDHYLFDLPLVYGGTLHTIHRALHVERAVYRKTEVTNEELADWMLPEWRGPYSSERSEET